MITGATGNDLDASGFVEDVFGRDTKRLFHKLRFADAARKGIANYVRLLVNLLEHVVTIHTFEHLVIVLVQANYVAFDRFAVIPDFNRI
jgi:hypothetical protein